MAMDNMSAQSMKLFADQLVKSPEFRKAVTTASGPQAYDLEPEVKSLFPVITPIRNEIPRFFSKQKGDVATHWQAITAINTATMPPVVFEGRRAGPVASNYVSKLAKYATLGLEDSVTEEAKLAAMSYDDVSARTVANLIYALMIQEELTYIGGNNSLLFGTTPTPTLSQTAGSGTFTSASTVSVICAALSLEGYNRASRNGNVPIASVTRVVVGSTLAAGPVTENIPGGVAQKSASATIVIGANGNSVLASVAWVNGAVAYAWYAGPAGSEALVALSTINSIAIVGNGSGQLASALPSADNSAYNDAPTGIDGILTQVMKSGSGASFTILPTGVAGVGNTLTSKGIAIGQIDAILQAMWNANQVTPDTIWVNAQELTNISDRIVAAGGAPLIRFNYDLNGNKNVDSLVLTAGAVVGFYLNRYGMGGPQNIAIRLHPNIPPGTMIMTSKRLPFVNSQIPDVLRVRGQLDYHEIVWGPFTRSDEYGVYMRGTLQCYFPGAFAVIQNIANG